MERIAGHAQGVVADLRRWVDLRVDLAVMDLEAKLDERLNAVVIGVILAVFGGLAAFFTLVTVALGLGWLLGHPFWGFLIVTIGLGATAAIVRARQPKLVRTKLYQEWQKAKKQAREEAAASNGASTPSGSSEKSTKAAKATPPSGAPTSENGSPSSTASS